MNGVLMERLEGLSPAKRALLEIKLKEKKSAAKDSFSIPARKNPASAPLSFNQESLLFIERLNPNTAAYNLYEAVKLTGNLDFDALRQTLDSIAARHESLRTSFREINGQTRQIIAPPQAVPIRIFDLSQSAADAREREAFDIMTAEIVRPMDLQSGNLFKAALVKLSARENFLLVVMHHIISDGWSIGVFWKEFSSFYKSFSEGNEPQLPELPIQFGDYAAWSRERLEKDFARQTEYWKNRLLGRIARARQFRAFAERRKPAFFRQTCATI
jgi:hypothetical protein